MSDVLFPDLRIGYDLTRKPMFNTKIMTSVNGREQRASYQAVPKYEFSLTLPGLQERKGELQAIEDFFIARRGAFDSFLFKMPWDNEYECIFNGDGTQTSFQLYKGQLPLGNTQSQVAFDADPTFWNEDDNQQFWSDNDDELFWDDTKITVSKSGLVQATKPLKAGHKFSVKGTFYYRCRFADDGQAFTLFSYRLWKGEVTLIGSLGNKV
ncbi:DUF2460 domain-containing protein [Acinetobacter sp. TR11]|uniref:DUF2460 domain-containing protein n=1 Tax=Acinetobacter sp. TR11 TaxID=3003393 RepID=UPI0022AC01DE|nr:DUF2460 domain-containing protein [Acinetobacter sp. TR11]WAU73082.1 DUF2460 domain-containing protein [Acinetobacter sp. TR11]